MLLLYLLLVSFYLSILTFYLGVLIYALPIPIAGLKRWGPRLINDAFFVAILSSSIELVLNFVDYLRHILGGDWFFFMATIKGFILYRSNLVVFIGIVKELASKIIPGVSRILSVGINTITISLYTSFLMYFLSLLIYHNIGTLISLGLTLIAIPFRIARNAGAYIISFSLVFYLGLPLYPNFLVLLATPTSRSVLDLVIIYGDIYTSLGYKLEDGFVGVKIDNEYIGPAKVTADGRMIILLPRKYIYSSATLYFDASGHRFYTNITDANLVHICRQEFSIQMCRADVSVKGILYYSKGMAIHMRPQPLSLTRLGSSHNYIEFNVYVDSETELFISIVDSYRVLRIIIDNTTIIENIDQYKSYSWVWYNVPGNTYVMTIQKGLHSIRIEYSVMSIENLEPKTEHLYPAKVLQLDILMINDIIDALAYSTYIEIISSILYLSLLMSIAYGLARVLGSSHRLRFIP